MGQDISFRCTKCEYNKSFHLGIGMMYSPSAVFDRSYFDEKPLPDSLVKSKKIKEQVFHYLKSNLQLLLMTMDMKYIIVLTVISFMNVFIFALFTMVAPMNQSINVLNANIYYIGLK